ncbi:protein artichoke-like [Saccostrea echinata]|uniref:protein artichoke-like n=1 Tax=Saccostrea echinata TaxID=191078 RepID=UPI002A82571C|nr:protein artichoke-like [Saccostrea echinata]
MGYLLTLTCLISLDIFCNFVHGFSTYPRRYNRGLDGGGTCPSQCRCMDLNLRGTRDVLDAVEGGSRWSAKGFEELTQMMSDAPANTGRTMVCQGLRRLPSPIPTDITKLTIYGDSSSGIPETVADQPRGDIQRIPLISDTQIRYIETNSFRDNTEMKELTMSGNNVGILYPYTFQHLRSLEVLNFPNNNVRHLSAAVFTGLTLLKQLQLSDNMFQFLPSTVFDDLQELRILNLNGNKIRYIQRNLFAPLRKLEILDLSRNNITDLFDDVFTTNVDIKELLLNGNRLRKIRAKWFENLSNLRSLSLRGNVIKSIESRTFTNLFNLEELLLSANHISEVKDNAFESLRDLKILDLATNDITDIPKMSFFQLESLEEMYLGGNKLQTVKNYTFYHIKFLKTLDISRNLIETIEYGSFHQLRHIQELDLSHNKLRKIEKDLVLGMEELREINLEHNFISDIEGEAFKTATDLLSSKVSVLDLQGNDLRKIGAESFKGLPQLKSLDMGNNKLRRVHSMAFASLGNLRKLTLSNNKLKNVNNGLFSNLVRLQELDLSTNKFQSVPSNAFSGLVDLEDLNIAHNSIHDLSDNALRPLRHLALLNMKGNKLLNFNFTWISNLPQLSSVDLSSNYLFWIDVPESVKLSLKELSIANNNLKTVPSAVKKILSHSAFLDMTGNAMDCDCKLRWLLDPGLSSTMHVDKMDEIICKTPDRLHGRKLKHLMDTDLECTDSGSQQHQSSLMCSAMTLQQKSSMSPRLGNKLSIRRHATVFDSNRQPVANGIVIANGWILTVGTAVESEAQSTINARFSVRIGRGKKPVRIISILSHPLVPMKMQQYNVALIRYSTGKRKENIDYPCFLTQNQYDSVSKIIQKVSFTTRLTTKRRYAKLKPKKGRLSRTCFSEKFICSKVKAGKKKKNESMLIDGSPLYLGRPGDSKMAGLGVYMKTTNEFEYAFLPIWSVSDWIGTVIKEFDSKCTVDKRSAKCENLKLPSIEDMIMELQPMEEH